jgi:hypothetical protein
VPKKSHKVLPLTEKVKVLDIRKEIKLYIEVAKIYGNNSSICEVVKEKQIYAGLAVAFHTAKVMTTLCDTCLVKMEKTLNLCMYTFLFLSVCQELPPSLLKEAFYGLPLAHLNFQHCYSCFQDHYVFVTAAQQ